MFVAVPNHHLAVPTTEGGDLVFAHMPGLGVRVWARDLARRVDETVRPGRRAAPLYGGGIAHAGWAQMEEFFAACAEADDPASPVALTAPRIVDALPIKVRSGHGPADKANRAFFNPFAVSPLHTTGSWTGPAPELLLVYVRKGSYFPEVPDMYVAPDSPVRGGFFATGLPELGPGADPGTAGLCVPAAFIPRPRIESFAQSLLRAVHGPQPGRGVDGMVAG